MQNVLIELIIMQIRFELVTVFARQCGTSLDTLVPFLIKTPFWIGDKLT
jgi:hypothetical protein